MVWSEKYLYAYLENPTDFLKRYLKDIGKPELAKGKSTMVFKVRLKGPRNNVIAFLKETAN